MESTSRRNLLLGLVGGAGALGLRSLVSGIPIAWLTSPRHALAQAGADSEPSRLPQFLILSASDKGDPINANVPGTYADPRIQHAADPLMQKTTLSLGGRPHEAAKPWADLPADVLARTTFFHHATLTNAHPNHPKVMALMGQTRRQEMLASIYAQALAPALGTVQAEPVVVGAADSGELLRYQGRTLPKISPRALRRVLGSTPGPLTNLRALRDRDLDRMNALFKEHGTNVQRAFLDRIAQSQAEARRIPEQLLDGLNAITSDDVNGQIIAAATLVKMKVAPVVSIHIPFGGDNHADEEFADETEQTVSGTAAIASLQRSLSDLGLREQTSFALLNVFGRTLSSTGRAGRTHNPNHAVSVLIGSAFRSGVIGGLEPAGNDFVAQAIDPASGSGTAGGAISREASMPSLAKTLGVALGVASTTLDAQILTGQVVTAALR